MCVYVCASVSICTHVYVCVCVKGGEEQVRAEPKIKEANVKRESKRERRRICRNYEGEESDGESRQAEDGGKGEETGGWRGRERKGRAKAEAGEIGDKEEINNEG